MFHYNTGNAALGIMGRNNIAGLETQAQLGQAGNATLVPQKQKSSRFTMIMISIFFLLIFAGIFFLIIHSSKKQIKE